MISQPSDNGSGLFVCVMRLSLRDGGIDFWSIIQGPLRARLGSITARQPNNVCIHDDSQLSLAILFEWPSISPLMLPNSSPHSLSSQLDSNPQLQDARKNQAVGLEYELTRWALKTCVAEVSWPESRGHWFGTCGRVIHDVALQSERILF